MLDVSRLSSALTAKRADFRTFDAEAVACRQRYRAAWQDVKRMDPETVAKRLPAEATPGARMTSEWLTASGGVIGEPMAFTSHAEAHAWAAEALAGRLTIGVDASQIEPLPEVLLPVAVLQVAHFLNPHDAQRPYRKDAETIVLSPAELASGGLEPKSEMVVRRLEAEAATLAGLIREAAGTTPTPVAFFDGALVITFADLAPPAMQQRYVRAMEALLKASRETGIPVVGYIDSSRAKDLTSLVGALFQVGEKQAPSDAALVADDVAGWGQRTAACQCQRSGIWQQYDPTVGAVGFTYLHTHAGLPSRLEFPLWVLEQGLLPMVVETVLAECVAGQGYPYALEVADAAAVLSVADRQVFERTLLMFAESEGWSLTRSHKAMSKGRRR